MTDRSAEELLAENAALRSELDVLRKRLDGGPSSTGVATEDAERYRSVVDTMVDGVISIDSGGIVQSFNPAAEKIFGYSEDEMVGCNVSMLMSSQDRDQHEEFISRYLHTGKRKIIGIGRPVMGQRRDGTIFPLDLAVGEFHLGGQHMFTGVFRDITRRRQLEQDLRQAQRMESIGQLAGGIAHDFNNQLGIILFDVDMLIASGGDDPTLKEDLQKIRKVVLRSADLTRQLLIFSRRQRIEPRPLDPNQHLGELQLTLGRLLGEEMHIDLQLGDDLPLINADPGNIDQITINLSVNARDAMASDGTVTIRTRRVMLTEEFCRRHAQVTPGEYCALQVSDTGTGMDDEVKDRIFEPFFTTKETGKGTGLGLSVVYGLVESHHGCIVVNSVLGRGSSFEIYLPVIGEALLSKSPAEEATAPDERQGQGERILLLEDQIELRERTERFLTKKGYTVTACASVAEARTAMSGHSAGFDLILSDIVLPDGRGTDLVAELLESNPDLNALFVTGYADVSLGWQRVADSEFPVLRKPLDVVQLLDRVRDALRPPAS